MAKYHLRDEQKKSDRFKVVLRKGRRNIDAIEDLLIAQNPERSMMKVENHSDSMSSG